MNDQALKVFVGQFLLVNGYDQVEDQAYNILTEIIAQYIQKVGISAKKIANVCNRGDVSQFDILTAMDQSGMTTQDISDFLESKQHKNNFTVLKRNFNSVNQQKNNQEITSKFTQQEAFDGLNLKQAQNTLKEYNDFFPNFPEKFSYRSTETKSKYNLSEALIKQKKLQQKLNINLEMSMIKEHSLKHKRTDSMEYEMENGNPFRAPMKKIKNIDSLNL